MKCFWLNHWWKVLPTYNIQTSYKPGFVRETTYEKRVCSRCNKEDSRITESKIIGLIGR